MISAQKLISIKDYARELIDSNQVPMKPGKTKVRKNRVWVIDLEADQRHFDRLRNVVREEFGEDADDEDAVEALAEAVSEVKGYKFSLNRQPKYHEFIDLIRQRHPRAFSGDPLDESVFIAAFFLGILQPGLSCTEEDLYNHRYIQLAERLQRWVLDHPNEVELLADWAKEYGQEHGGL